MGAPSSRANIQIKAMGRDTEEGREKKDRTQKVGGKLNKHYAIVVINKMRENN